MTGTRCIAVITGSRAEFGLLRPVMTAIKAHRSLDLQVVAAGAHLLTPARTIDEVRSAFDIAVEIPMQIQDRSGRLADAAATGRGISAIATWLERSRPEVVLVLGDRIEAFAAAAGASVGGVRVAHMHGGDRAEGVADEAMRHAITKLAHIHLPATQQSADRIIAMGEDRDRVHIVGSPAVDGLDAIAPLDDTTFVKLGQPDAIVLLHPVGRSDDDEFADAHAMLTAVQQRYARPLIMMPNHDPGRAGVLRAIDASGLPTVDHLPRETFLALLKRVGRIVGNSSAGLIECAALGVWAVNIGPRQSGRERAANVRDVPQVSVDTIDAAIASLVDRPASHDHPFGDGRAGPRTAEVLATFDPHAHPLRKCNTY